MNKYVKNLDRIEFVVTFACTGFCKHCSQGSHENQKEYIDAATAASIVRDIASKYTPFALKSMLKCLSRKFGERFKSIVPLSYDEVFSVPCCPVYPIEAR